MLGRNIRRRRRLLVVGDSVILGAATPLGRLRGWNVILDAEVNRFLFRDTVDPGGQPVRSGFAAIDEHLASSTFDAVALHIGHNGRMTEAHADEAMQRLDAVPLAYWINLREPREWERPNNDVIAAVVDRNPRATLVDWKAASDGRDDWLHADGLHLTDRGARALTRLLARHLR